MSSIKKYNLIPINSLLKVIYNANYFNINKMFETINKPLKHEVWYQINICL